MRTLMLVKQGLRHFCIIDQCNYSGLRIKPHFFLQLVQVEFVLLSFNFGTRARRLRILDLSSASSTFRPIFRPRTRHFVHALDILSVSSTFRLCPRHFVRIFDSFRLVVRDVVTFHHRFPTSTNSFTYPVRLSSPIILFTY